MAVSQMFYLINVQSIYIHYDKTVLGDKKSTGSRAGAVAIRGR